MDHTTTPGEPTPRHKTSLEGFFNALHQATFPRPDEPKDPLWRRLLIGLGLYLECWADRWFPGDYPCAFGITWQDRARWKVENIGSWIFRLGHEGSQAEHEMILAGELELNGLTWAQREKYLPILAPFVLIEDLRSCIIRWSNELFELDDEHPGFDALDEEAAEAIRLHLREARAQLFDAAHAITRELSADVPQLLLEDRRAA